MVRTRSLVPCLLAAANCCVVLPFTFQTSITVKHFATGCSTKQLKHKRLSFTTFSRESVSVLVLQSLDLCPPSQNAHFISALGAFPPLDGLRSGYALFPGLVPV